MSSQKRAINLERPGTYVLVMRLLKGCCVGVGALGECSFHPGWYLYVGSAMGGLGHRLRRHARRSKRMHWHIDHVLARADLVEVWVHVGQERLECKWAAALAALDGITPYDRRLGASDCACATHLLVSDARPKMPDLAQVADHCLSMVPVEDLRAPASRATLR